MPAGLRKRYTDPSELPEGFLDGPTFSAVLDYLKSGTAFVLVADRSIDWNRYQQEWRRASDGVKYVLDYPFERSRGSWLPKAKHPTVHVVGAKP